MLANASAIKLREYERIFTGTNQDTGYTNPILNFVSDTTLQTFPCDKVTYFHYPLIATSNPLSASNLIQCGAVASNIPYRADKIWKKMANYSSSSIWGNAQPVGKQTGVWLCAWLSGNMLELSATPIWMDRWYNPGYMDAENAMFVSQPLSGIITDIPSEMIFDAGCWYKYFHVGNTHNESIVNSLTGSNNTHLKLRLDDWSENTLDQSPYNNTSIIENYTPSCISIKGVNTRERPNDNALFVTDNQHCHVLHNSSYSLSGDFSYSVWVKPETWNNIQGYNIVSKNFRGGWGLKSDNGFYTPTMTLLNRTGNMLCLNTEGQSLKYHQLPSPSEPKAVVIDSNLFGWVLDNGVYQGYKHLYKIDYNGDIRDSIQFNASETLKHLAIDGNDNLWVLANGSVSGFDSYLGNLITSFPTSIANNYIDLSLINQVSCYTSSFTFDNSGNFLSAGSNETFAYQSDDSIWVLSGANLFYKKDLTGTVLLSGNVGISTALSGRNLNFTREFTNGISTDYVWMIQEADQALFKYDTDGNLVTRINLSEYDFSPYIIGDFTGYQRNRKFDYVHYNKIPQIQSEVFLNSTPLSGNKYTLSIPVTEISNDWHMFTFTFNQSSINLYMDSVLRDSQTFSEKMYINYSYDNPLILGLNTGKLISLDEELFLKNMYFTGSIDDLRIYDVVLNNSDIRHIYFSKFDFKDLNWNMPTGDQSYLEEIERFFKFKMSGCKSPYYNIKLINLQITDLATREVIENIIKKTIKKVAPAYSELYKIIWI